MYYKIRATVGLWRGFFVANSKLLQDTYFLCMLKIRLIYHRHKSTFIGAK